MYPLVFKFFYLRRLETSPYQASFSHCHALSGLRVIRKQIRSCKTWQKFTGGTGWQAWCSCSALLKLLAGRCSPTSWLPAARDFPRNCDLSVSPDPSSPQPPSVHMLRCSYLLCAVVWRCPRLLPIDDAQTYTAVSLGAAAAGQAGAPGVPAQVGW